MKKLGILVFTCLLTINNLYANEDKLDVLDQQSKEFFKAITGLEKDYLEEQIVNIKNKENRNPNVNNQNNRITPVSLPQEKQVSQEEYEKKVFKHENEMARLTTDFTRTKKLKDLKIKSMYSFNGKSFVNLKLESNKNQSGNDKESSLNIEGRYTIGDYILTHKIIDINTRTKTVKLYKKLDEEYGYIIYLSNYGISVSDLEKRPKKEEVKKIGISKNEDKKLTESIKEKFSKIENKVETKTMSKEDTSSCLYTVNVTNLNVRNSTNFDATILRILRINDQFTISQRKEDWLKINTIYKKKSGDVMLMEDKNNWVNISGTTGANVTVNDKNCL